MTKTSMFAALMMVGVAGVAEAGGSAGTIGVGAEYQISGVGGASMNYDAGDFHVGGFLGFADDDGADNTVFQIGGRFFWHVHSTTDADFGVGGTIGILSFPDNMPGSNDRLTAVFVEPGVQIRVFLAANVALSANTGIILGVVDADGVGITGSTIGSSGGFSTTALGFGGGAGLHYYFF
jgi:hypothetical protein